MGLNFANLDARKLVGSLNRQTQKLDRTFERLSSGQRINRASDDPGGLAISERLKSDTRVATRGKLNVNDGVSLLQVADGALESIESMLTRMGELAEQAANGTFSSAQRSALDKEYQALDQEIRRVIETTTFNGVSLLKGTLSSKSVEQLTSTTGGAGATAQYSVSGDGRYVTYYDPSDGFLKQRDTVNNTSTNITNQIQSTSQIVGSASGEMIVFESTSNITGENGSARNQLFLYNRVDGSISQLTSALSGSEDYNGLAISADGSTVGFSTRTAYQSGLAKGGATGSTARAVVATMNIASGLFNVPTMSAVLNGTISDMSLSADGSKLVFASTQNITGGNADANAEAYYVNLAGQSPSITQVTNTTTASPVASLAVTNAGKIYFTSSESPGGTNSALTSNAFEYNVSSATFTNLTNNTTAQSVGDLTVNNDGSSLVFISRTDFDSGQALSSTSNLFKLDFSTGQISQQTNLANLPSFGSNHRKISADGHTMYALSNGNFAGQNSDANVELFKQDFTTDAFNINVESGSGFEGNIMSAIAGVNGTLRGLGSHALTAQSGARGALDATALNLGRTSLIRGVLGAGLSRLESAGRVLSGQELELSAANARIRDIDVAEETASMLRIQIQQSATTALLAQANQQPAMVFQLLNSAARQE